jgi:hypothetical protein
MIFLMIERYKQLIQKKNFGQRNDQNFRYDGQNGHSGRTIRSKGSVD